MGQNTIVQLSGRVKMWAADKTLKAKATGKPFTIYTFILVPDSGEKDIFVQVFGNKDLNLVGKQVSFNAEFNEEYKSHKLEGDINVLGEASGAASQTLVSGSPAAPAKTREEFRDAAVQAVVTNLNSATEIVNQLELEVTGISDLVAIADMLGRTMTAITLDSNRR